MEIPSNFPARTQQSNAERYRVAALSNIDGVQRTSNSAARTIIRGAMPVLVPSLKGKGTERHFGGAVCIGNMDSAVVERTGVLSDLHVSI